MKNQHTNSFERYKAALLERGLPMKLCASIVQMSGRVEKYGCKRRYKEGATEHIARYLGEFRQEQRQEGEATGPEINVVSRQPYPPARHPRDEEIAAATPDRFVSMRGIGHGSEHHNGYGRGR